MNRDQRGPVLFQQSDHGCPSEHGGEHDGGKPPSVIGMDVGAMPEKQLSQLKISLESHAPKRGLPLVIATIHIGACFQEHPGSLEMPVIRGEQEQGIAARIAEIHRQTLPEHAGQRVRLSETGTLESKLLKLTVTRLLLGIRDDVLHEGSAVPAVGRNRLGKTASRTGSGRSDRGS